MFVNARLKFAFPSRIFAVLAVNYTVAEERGKVFCKSNLDFKSKVKEETRILREINPRITAVLRPPSRAGFKQINAFEPRVSGSEHECGAVNVFFPNHGSDELELNHSVITSTTSGIWTLEGKSVTLCSSRDDGPVLLVWKEDACTPEEYLDEYKQPLEVFANETASIIGAMKRLVFNVV